MKSSTELFRINSIFSILLSVFLISACGTESGSIELTQSADLSDEDYVSALSQKTPVLLDGNRSQQHNLEVEIEFKKKASRADEYLFVTVVIDTDSSGDETADDLRFEVLLKHFCYTADSKEKCVLSVRDEHYLAGYRETRGSYFATIGDRMSYGADIDDDSLRVRFSLESVFVGDVSRALAQSQGAFSVTVQRLSGGNIEEAHVLSEDRIPSRGTLEIVNQYVIDPIDDYSGNYDSADFRAVRVVNRFFDDVAVSDEVSPENFVNQNPIARLEEFVLLSRQYLSGLEFDQSLPATLQNGQNYTVVCDLLGHHTNTDTDVCINYGIQQESFSPLVSEDFDFVYIVPPKTTGQLEQAFDALNQQKLLPVFKNELSKGEHKQRAAIEFVEPLHVNSVGLTDVTASCRIVKGEDDVTEAFALVETSSGSFSMPSNNGFDLRQGEYSLSCSLSGRNSSDHVRQTGETLVYEFTIVENVIHVADNGDCGFCDGLVITDTGEGGDNSLVAISEDNKERVVVVGKNQPYIDSRAMTLRYLANGQLDESFSADGVDLIAYSEGDSQFNDLFVQNDHKIVAAGTLDDDLMVVRYLENGDLDSSFGQDGKAIVDMGLPFFRTRSIIGLDDGSFLVAGSGSTLETNFGNRVAVVKLDANGELDSQFGSEGIALLGSTDLGGALSDMFVTEYNKIVVSIYHPEEGISLMQLTETGDIDATFGDGEYEGVQAIDGLTEVIEIEAYGEGGFMVLGTNREGGLRLPRIVKLDRDGVQQNFEGDQPFAPLTDIYNVEGISLLSDGSYAIVGSSGLHVAVLKIDQAARPISTFGSNGLSVLDLKYSRAWGKDILELSDGALVVGASVYDLHNEPVVLIKMQANGQIYLQ